LSKKTNLDQLKERFMIFYVSIRQILNAQVPN